MNKYDKTMNKIFLGLLITFVILPVILSAQISEGGLPQSYSAFSLKSTQPIPVFQLQTLSVDSLVNENEKNGTPYRYSAVTSTSIDLRSGLNTHLSSGEIWRYTISSENAKSLKIIFTTFNIPDGAKLFLYNSDYSEIYGAFTSGSGDDLFPIADFPGNELTLEYYEPTNTAFEGELIIGQIGQAFIDLDTVFEEAGNDYIDVNCDEGINWQLEKHAVCKYTFTEDGSGYTCTGALINNVNNDGTPYFLTASHCISSSSVASTVVAYFNYETKGCGLSTKASKTLNQAKLLSTGSASDFTLLKFFSSPPESYQPFYAGWDLSDEATSAVGIHHPEGLIKKIAIEKNPPVTYNQKITWEGNDVSPAQTHWQVFFDEGKTAGGSSGSPLFNQNKRIIGQLHGGGDYDDYYGKLNYSWTHNAAIFSSLKSYLASNGSTDHIDGYYPSGNPPEAVFSADYTYVCVGAAVELKDYSVFGITDWHWTISPSNVTFLDNTSAESQNPVVSFDAAGDYTVKLAVKNANGKDSVNYQSVIIAGDAISVSYNSDTESGNCYDDVDSITLTAKGAPEFEWNLDDNSNSYFQLQVLNANQAVIKKRAEAPANSTITINGTIKGVQGDCSDQASFSIELIKQSNDDIADALQLNFGENGPFTNNCATIEENEPVPPVGRNNCVSQTSWCDEYDNGENIIENTLWFYFESTHTGTVTIDATGMDGQIALYGASSYEAILNGNYTLIAANDDISNTNYNSRIDNASVEKNKTYWVQFDGSAGGSIGEFTMGLSYTSDVESLTTANDSPITLYPQPANEYVIAESNLFNGLNEIRINIYNSLGKMVYTDETDVNENYVTVDLAGYQFTSGLYIISFICSQQTFSQKLMLTNR